MDENHRHAARMTLLLGGARSGKSRHAVRLARGDGSVLFIATADPADEEMAERVRRHRAERPDGWRTLEAATDLVARVPEHVGPGDTVVLDCLSLWVGSLVAGLDGRPPASEEEVLRRTEKLLAAIASHGRRWLVVSNEVGAGLHPPTALGRRYRDVLGLVNQRVAAAADRVLYLVAGIPVEVEPSGP